MDKPEKIEYNPYFQDYIDLVPLGNFQQTFLENTENTIEFFENIPAYKHDLLSVQSLPLGDSELH